MSSPTRRAERCGCRAGRSNVWVPSVAKAKAIKDPDTYKPIPHQAGAYSRFTAYLRQFGYSVKACPLIVVSQHLGHEDVSVTAKVYGHLDRTAGQAAAAALATVLA